MEMEGKVVVVTGASMGIGEAIAKIFADPGAGIVMLSRDASRAEAARHRVGHTERTLALACDVRHREEIDRALGLMLHHFDRVDVWVNNAGVGMRDSVADMEMPACRELFDTNLFGAIACMQSVVPAMAGQGKLLRPGSERPFRYPNPVRPVGRSHLRGSITYCCTINYNCDLHHDSMCHLSRLQHPHQSGRVQGLRAMCRILPAGSQPQSPGRRTRVH